MEQNEELFLSQWKNNEWNQHPSSLCVALWVCECVGSFNFLLLCVSFSITIAFVSHLYLL